MHVNPGLQARCGMARGNRDKDSCITREKSAHGTQKARSNSMRDWHDGGLILTHAASPFTARSAYTGCNTRDKNNIRNSKIADWMRLDSVWPQY
jgi:hypothetical protein